MVGGAEGSEVLVRVTNESICDPSNAIRQMERRKRRCVRTHLASDQLPSPDPMDSLAVMEWPTPDTVGPTPVSVVW